MTKISKIGVERMQKVLHSLFAFARCASSLNTLESDLTKIGLYRGGLGVGEPEDVGTVDGADKWAGGEYD